MKNKQGFTLIELMIVIAIIAIIAAIAIPGLLSSQRASNERNASASLKTLASAEADFRGNDRDGNKIQDFWTVDVSGLYGALPVGSGEMVKLIEISVAGADFCWNTTGGGTIGTAGNTDEVPPGSYAVLAPKAGYWYSAMSTDENGNVYQTATNGVLDTNGGANANSWYNHSKFAFYAFPDSFSAGRNVFFVNEGNTIFKRPMNGPVKDPASTPAGGYITLTTGGSGIIGTQVAETWPVDTVLRSQYSKLD